MGHTVLAIGSDVVESDGEQKSDEQEEIKMQPPMKTKIRVDPEAVSFMVFGPGKEHMKKPRMSIAIGEGGVMLNALALVKERLQVKNVTVKDLDTDGLNSLLSELGYVKGQAYKMVLEKADVPEEEAEELGTKGGANDADSALIEWIANEGARDDLKVSIADERPLPAIIMESKKGKLLRYASHQYAFLIDGQRVDTLRGVDLKAGYKYDLDVMLHMTGGAGVVHH